MEAKKHTIADLPRRAKASPYVSKLRTTCQSNLYPVQLKSKDKSVQQYQISFVPEIPADSRDVIKKSVRAVKQQIEKKIGPNFIHRGNLIWSLDTVQHKELVFTEGLSEGLSLKLTFVKSFELKDLDGISDECKKVLQLLGAKFKKGLMDSGYIEHGRTAKFYRSDGIKKIEGTNLEAWPGYTLGLRFIGNRLFLQIDAITRILRKETVKEILDQSSKIGRDDLIGKVVMASYGNYFSYTIKGIDTKLTPNSTFEANGKVCTYAEYFKSKYGVAIKDTKQPMVVSQVKDKVHIKGELKEVSKTIYLIPELLNLTGIQDTSDRNLMKKLDPFTKLNPQERIKDANNILKNKDVRDNDLFQIVDKPEVVEAFRLPQVRVELGKGVLQRLGSRGLLLEPMRVQNWLLFCNQYSQRTVDSFVNNIMKAQESYGIRLSEPRVIRSVDMSTIQNEVKNRKPEFVVTYLSKRDSDRMYSSLKVLCLTKLGVIHQHVTTDSSSNPKTRLSVVSKILLQINAKLGNALWRVPLDHPELKNKKIAVGGIVFHHHLVKGHDSAVGLVGSLDKEGTKFFTHCKLIPINTQTFDMVEKAGQKWMMKYAEKNKSLPEIVVVYRIGVGEGSIDAIQNSEVKPMLSGLKRAATHFGVPVPKLAFVSVNKKSVHQKIYTMSGENPGAGTVVGASVSRYGFDFHLLSQPAPREGTSKPTQYNLLHDQTGLCEDAFWQITNNQCNNYANWQGGISMPAPMQYCYKLVKLVGDTLKAEPKDTLDTMNFML